MDGLPPALTAALQAHQAGQVAQAESLYRQFLQTAPQLAEGHHLLGVLLHQMRRHGEAATILARAVELDGNRPDFLNHWGAALGAAGDTAAARQAFERALRLTPNDAQSHYNLAALHGLCGNAADAENHYRHAVQLQPAFAEAWYNLANLLRDAEKSTDAVACYRQALTARPGYQKAALSLAALLTKQGEYQPAIDLYRQVLQSQPNHAEAHFRLGSLLQEQGDLDAAAYELQTALQLKPDHAEAHNNLGCIWRNREDYVQAVASFQLALQYKPDFAEALTNLGTALQGMNRLDEAIEYYRQAVEKAPELAAAHMNLGSALHQQGQHEQAIDALRRAIELNPKSADAHSNLGAALLSVDRFDEAMAAHQQALAINPQHADTHFNLGAAYHVRSNWKQAVSHYERAISLKPDHAEAHYSRALVQLAQGDFANGWQGYEWRLRCKRFVQPHVPGPRWRGEALADKTLFVHAEQGLGDTLQFIRYVNFLRKIGAHIITRVPKTLLPLLTASGFSDLIPTGQSPAQYDYHIPLMSLPGVLGTTLRIIPSNVPYIHARPDLVERWRNQLAAWPGLRIGINWQGNPQYTFDRYRSFPLAELASAAAVPGVRLISLQKEHGLNQLAEVADQFEVIDLGDQLDRNHGPFMDTAAVIANLDLVVTSDSAVAHLAGAMGAKVWLATSHAAEWRWLTDRPDSPWYPTMKLFRQPTLGDWASVFASMAQQLSRHG